VREETTIPNWCENRLTITGPAADVDALVAEVVVPNPDQAAGVPYAPKRALDYAALLPVPEGISDPNPDFLSDAEWKWRIAHWGCKWNHPALVEDERFDPAGTAHLEYAFDSPWSPPLPFVDALARAFPILHLVLRYEEAGMGLYGRFDSDDIPRHDADDGEEVP
jgi:hypothetical protein